MEAPVLGSCQGRVWRPVMSIFDDITVFQITSFSSFLFSVHTRKQRFRKASFSNRSTLDSVFEWLGFRRCSVDDSRIRSKTALFFV